MHFKIKVENVLVNSGGSRERECGGLEGNSISFLQPTCLLVSCKSRSVLVLTKRHVGSGNEIEGNYANYFGAQSHFCLM